MDPSMYPQCHPDSFSDGGRYQTVERVTLEQSWKVVQKNSWILVESPHARGAISLRSKKKSNGRASH